MPCLRAAAVLKVDGLQQEVKGPTLQRRPKGFHVLLRLANGIGDEQRLHRQPASTEKQISRPSLLTHCERNQQQLIDLHLQLLLLWLAFDSKPGSDVLQT